MARLAPSNLNTGAIREKESGKYFVNDSRIDCELCRQTAPFFLPQRHLENEAIYHQREQLRLMEEEREFRREEWDTCSLEIIGYKLA